MIILLMMRITLVGGVRPVTGYPNFVRFISKVYVITYSRMQCILTLLFVGSTTPPKSRSSISSATAGDNSSSAPTNSQASSSNKFSKDKMRSIYHTSTSQEGGTENGGAATPKPQIKSRYG